MQIPSLIVRGLLLSDQLCVTAHGKSRDSVIQTLNTVLFNFLLAGLNYSDGGIKEASLFGSQQLADSSCLHTAVSKDGPQVLFLRHPHWIDQARILILNSDFPLASAAFELAINVAWANMKSEMYKVQGPLIGSLLILSLEGVASAMQPRLSPNSLRGRGWL